MLELFVSTVYLLILNIYFIVIPAQYEAYVVTKLLWDLSAVYAIKAN